MHGSRNSTANDCVRLGWLRGAVLRRCVLFAAGVLLALGVSWAWAFVHDGKSAAIEVALPQLDLEKNPYLLRESWWHETFREKGDVKLIQHQLFKRNDYWFWAGLSDVDAKVSVHIYNSEGELAEDEDFQRDHTAGARIVPEASGNYYIRVELLDNPNGEDIDWAVIYAFR